jgi:glycosyltransferase involved in cell wall biosynthesis
MISVITAIYNQRAMNELFWEKLKQYTHYPFELIIVDNGSTDGSADFFESVGAKVIRNSANFSYPHTQNQGIAVAQYDNLAFLNNDIIVSPDWDKYLLASMARNGLEVATVCGIEQVENFNATKKLKRRWKKVKNVLGLFGYSSFMLKLMHRLMYGNWEKFCSARRSAFPGAIKEGFVGNTVMIHRNALAKIGLWDEKIQEADFDLYLRTKQRADQFSDIKPVHICLDVFVHHYIRLSSSNGSYPPFVDRANLISIDEKWPASARAAFDNINK